MSDETAKFEFASANGDEQSDVPKLLIVDDEDDVHRVTRLVLSELPFEGRGLELHHAYSADEAITTLRDHPDTAVMLLDIVMESENAGWDVVRRTREELNNHDVQIIVRTGYPGTLPEQELIDNYDINDYRGKGELTRDRMYIAVSSALQAYRNLHALRATLDALNRVPLSTAPSNDAALDALAAKQLAEFTHAMHVKDAFVLLERPGTTAARGTCHDNPISSGTGSFASIDPGAEAFGLDAALFARIETALDRDKSSVAEPNERLLSCLTGNGRRAVLYLQVGRNNDNLNAQSLKWFVDSLADSIELHNTIDAIRGTLTELSRRMEQHARKKMPE